MGAGEVTMRYYIVDAFTDRPFGGNPAGVVLLGDEPFPDEGLMIQVAAELRYSETAFVRFTQTIKHSDNQTLAAHVRYFTPKAEVELCGHATVATFALLHRLGLASGHCLCHTLAGDLAVEAGERVMMQMSTPRIIETIKDTDAIYKALGIDQHPTLPVQVAYSGLADIMIPVPDVATLNALQPDMEAVAAITKEHDTTSFHVFALPTQTIKQSCPTAGSGLEHRLFKSNMRKSIQAINAEFQRVVDFWDERLSHIQVETPDRSLNYMLNRWYLYQVYSSRLFARAGFYQVGGATGFRDQLQDVMSILYSDPDYARRQILDHAAHQFAQGDVLHWWHESLHLGARTTFSDDYLWLPFVTYQYISVTGDTSILSEQVPFCQAEQLRPDETERGVNYTTSTESASLYEHLRRSIDRSLSRIGSHGLPLMGCGDWNDGMSAVGAQGKGESVWVAFFLADLLPKMEHITQLAPGADLSYCQQLSSARKSIVDAIQRTAWDGAWFLRAYFDNGDPMGSRNNTECQIDLISQAWSILTDVATAEQKESVFRETDRRLVNREHEIIQLLTPAFKDSQPSPGYIANYPVGVRENGGQYTHGAMWYIMAQLKEGRYDMAYYLYSLINPIHRTQSLADVLKYKVEPYCIAADIYSNPQHPGRGGWTWYTGSASWAYKTGIENILGFQLRGNQLTIDPHVPTDWPAFNIRYQFGNSIYIFYYTRKQSSIQTITLVDDGQVHEINL